MKRCEECQELKSALPFLFEYHDDDLHPIEERRTCEVCWRRLKERLKIISHGPMVKRNKVRYERVTVVGKPNKYQMELF